MQFQRSGGSYYYVKADPGAFTATDQILQAYKLQKAEQEKELIQQKGAVPYYIEKYGVWVIGAVLAIVAVKELIKKK